MVADSLLLGRRVVVGRRGQIESGEPDNGSGDVMRTQCVYEAFIHDDGAAGVRRRGWRAPPAARVRIRQSAYGGQRRHAQAATDRNDGALTFSLRMR